MPPEPITVKLRIRSWEQLEAIHRRDLSRSALFLKSSNRPPLGVRISINLTMPSGTLIILSGTISEHVPPGGLEGRGPGVDIALDAIPQSTMWLIESALSSVRRERERRGADRRRPESQPKPDPQPEADTPLAEDPSMEDGAPLVAAEGGLVQALAQELAVLRNLNPFQVLGIPYDSDDAAVRAAFAELTKRYHPDRFARYQSGGARKRASEIFILIRDAYRRLSDPASRQRELRSVDAATGAGGAAPGARPQVPPSPARAATPRRAVPAAASPRQRQSRLSETTLFGNVSTPPSTEPEPIDLADAAPTNPGPHAEADALLDAGNYDEAVAIYRLAARRNHGDPRALAGLELAEGLKALAEGDRLEAAQRFEAVLEIDPANERAGRELAELRRRATNERKGFLTRLLGKKEGS